MFDPPGHPLRYKPLKNDARILMARLWLGWSSFKKLLALELTFRLYLLVRNTVPHDKDFAERSGELSGAICLRTLVLLGNDREPPRIVQKMILCCSYDFLALWVLFGS